MHDLTPTGGETGDRDGRGHQQRARSGGRPATQFRQLSISRKEARTGRRERACEEPLLSLIGLRTTADKGIVKLAGGEWANTLAGMSGEEARRRQRRGRRTKLRWQARGEYASNPAGPLEINP